MGQTKRRIDRETEHGYYSINSRVCNNCISNKHIKRFIKQNGKKSICNYCENKQEYTVEFNDFIEYIVDRVNNHYSNPLDDLVSFDDSVSFGIVELLSDNIDVTEKENLRNDIENSLSDCRWCEPPYYLPDLSDALQYGWDKFVRTVKHKSRYNFYEFEGYEHNIIPSSAFLESLSDIISRLNLYKTLKKGYFLYRIRIEDEETTSKNIKCVSDVAPNKPENSKQANRMSPAGIPMFYGAFDIKTAIQETYHPEHYKQIATVAKFKLLKDITLVDLTHIPPYLDFFEDTNYCNHHIDFLEKFVAAISKPIEKNGIEHIEYAPTQIITEHFRDVHHKQNDNERIYGLIYPSSKSQGKNSVVIFCENQHCVEKGEAKEDSFFELELPLRGVNPEKYNR